MDSAGMTNRLNDIDDDEFIQPEIVKASYANDYETVARLLNEGADPNEHDQLGATALHGAAVRDNAAMARLLISHGADARFSLDGEWPPIYAAVRNSVEVTKLLIDQGVDVNASVGSSGDTPMTWASHENRADIAEVLRHAGAAIRALDLLTAVEDNHWEMARFLIEHGANPFEVVNGLPGTPSSSSSIEAARRMGHDKLADWMEHAR
jgi:ankyrin repeat protein